MNKLFLAALASSALAVPSVASAQDTGYEAGDIKVRAFATVVLPDGGISNVEVDGIGLPGGSDTEASDSIVPTVTAEYFVTPNISFETIIGVTPHDVDGVGGIEGAELIEDLIILPATLSAKYHIGTGSGFKPYLGAGVTRFFIFGEGLGADAVALGADDVDLSNEFGFVLQGGFDVPINNGVTLSADVRRYFVGTTATFSAGGATALQTEHDLDPWVLSAGVGFKF